jgi:hypothetical protein
MSLALHPGYATLRGPGSAPVERSETGGSRMSLALHPGYETMRR